MGLDFLLPEAVSAGFAALLVAASFGTSALTAAIGLGGGILMLTLMAHGVPVAALIPFHGAVQLGSNGGRLLIQRRNVAWPFLAAFAIGGVFGGFAGAFLVTELPEGWLRLALGLFVLAVTWLPIPRFGDLGWHGIASAGFVSTFLSMFVGATGPLNAAIFSATLPKRQQLVATLAATMTWQHLMKVAAFTLAGFAFAEWMPLIAAMALTGFAGTFVGSRLLTRIPEKIFRRALKVVLTVLAGDLVRRGLLLLL